MKIKDYLYAAQKSLFDESDEQLDNSDNGEFNEEDNDWWDSNFKNKQTFEGYEDCEIKKRLEEAFRKTEKIKESKQRVKIKEKKEPQKESRESTFILKVLNILYENKILTELQKNPTKEEKETFLKKIADLKKSQKMNEILDQVAKKVYGVNFVDIPKRLKEEKTEIEEEEKRKKYIESIDNKITTKTNDFVKSVYEKAVENILTHEIEKEGNKIPKENQPLEIKSMEIKNTVNFKIPSHHSLTKAK